MRVIVPRRENGPKLLIGDEERVIGPRCTDDSQLGGQRPRLHAAETAAAAAAVGVFPGAVRTAHRVGVVAAGSGVAACRIEHRPRRRLHEARVMRAMSALVGRHRRREHRAEADDDREHECHPRSHRLGAH
ncbi:hypothetical protein DB459_16465 [Bradyrhizobium sp. WD16]|nr:hypothetical protein DB459_16465 [Bradyrhizobium sp. WD16]